MTDMVKQPLGGSSGRGGSGGGDGGVRSKVPPCNECKVVDKHPYNVKTFKKFKHCSKIDSHDDDKFFDLEINTHRCPTYWKTGKRKWHEGGGAMNTV